MELVRARTKNLADNSQRTAIRVEEIRKELLLGPQAHLPGQIGRLEGWLHRQEGARPTPPSRLGTPNTPQSAFDDIFILNLDRDREKLAHVTAMLEAHKVPASRFPAIDGNSAEFDEEWEDYAAAEPTLPTERYTGNLLIESRGAWGYLKTMQSLLQSAKKRDLHQILILEDDVMLHRDFTNLFAAVWAEVPEDWKLVYLGRASADPSKITPFSTHLFHPGAMANGSYAIAVHSSVFDQALASISRFDWPFDAGALREIDASYPTQVFASDPPLVLADVSQSAIRPGRSMEDHATKHGWDLADYESPLGADSTD
jgi:hypothetical protein